MNEQQRNFGFLMKAVILMGLVCSLACCTKKEEKPYSYLNERLNKSATISNAELIVLKLEKWASYEPMSTKTSSGNFSLRLTRAQIFLNREEVSVIADMDIPEELSQRWIDHSSREEREQDSRNLGVRVIKEIARQLECDPALIKMDIQSHTAMLNVKDLRVEP